MKKIWKMLDFAQNFWRFQTPKNFRAPSARDFLWHFSIYFFKMLYTWSGRVSETRGGKNLRGGKNSRDWVDIICQVIYMPSNLDFWVGQKIQNFPKQHKSIVFVFLHPIICIWAPQANFLCFWYSKYHFYNEISILFMKIFACGARDPQELYICPVIYMPSNPDFWSDKAPPIYMPSYIYAQWCLYRFVT